MQRIIPLAGGLTFMKDCVASAGPTTIVYPNW